MSSAEYAASALFWIVLMAGAGWAVGPAINYLIKRGGRR